MFEKPILLDKTMEDNCDHFLGFVRCRPLGFLVRCSLVRAVASLVRYRMKTVTSLVTVMILQLKL